MHFYKNNNGTKDFDSTHKKKKSVLDCLVLENLHSHFDLKIDSKLNLELWISCFESEGVWN